MKQNFPGGPTGKDPPANAWWFDPWSSRILHAAGQPSPASQLLSPLAATTEAQAPRACAQQ